MALSGLCPSADQILDAEAKVARIQGRIDDYLAQDNRDYARTERGWLVDAIQCLNFLIDLANGVMCTMDDRIALRSELIAIGRVDLAGKVGA